MRDSKVQSNFKKILGSRILSEANDLKRTWKALASELNIEEAYVKRILEGDCEESEIYELIRKMGDYYPIDSSDMLLIKDDCKSAIKIMRTEESRLSSRIFKRKNRDGGDSPYYEYRDTAMSSVAPFKPEWIKELREVTDSDPENPDVIYNNGHFLHQTTFFIGPVNFYWEINGKKHCKEMNTGDSNYITPFCKHSFASRDPNKETVIVAVTFGGEVRRAQKELYVLGEKSRKYFLDYRNPEKATRQLIRQHMKDNCLSEINLLEKASELSHEIDWDRLFDESKSTDITDVEKVAECLGIPLHELLPLKYDPAAEVVVKHRDHNQSYAYPDSRNTVYKIRSLANTKKIPRLRTFDLTVLAQNTVEEAFFNSSLHSYVYNYGDTAINLSWRDNELEFQETLFPGDSVYMQPFVEHAFAADKNMGNILLVRISGCINSTTQQELSTFSELDRVVGETKQWFN
jgi:hypothetical protein